jgi:hypothetical protein
MQNETYLLLIGRAHGVYGSCSLVVQHLEDEAQTMIKPGSRLQLLGRMRSVKAFDGEGITLAQPLEAHDTTIANTPAGVTDLWIFIEQPITNAPNADYQLLLHNMG